MEQRLGPEAGKLVRDKIPGIARHAGDPMKTVQIEGGTLLRQMLAAKLEEEAGELKEAVTGGEPIAEAARAQVLDEASDVFEVVRTILPLYGHTMADLLNRAGEKRAERGGFEKGTFWITNDERKGEK